MRYKLLKDLPGIEAGTEFDMDSSQYVGIFNFLEISGQGGFKGFTNKDWFSPIPDEPQRWRAERGTNYWFFNHRLEIGYYPDLHDPGDHVRWKIGNYFSSRESAELMTDKIHKLLKENL